MTIDQFIGQLMFRLDIKYTDEQVAFFENFLTPTISFSLPGTGKTASAISGLLTAELFHGVPADKIYALSFTRMATMELQHRHEDACDKLGIRSKIHFRTLHSICSAILRENHTLLDMETYKVGSSLSYQELGEYLLNEASSKGIPLAPNNVRNVIQAIQTLNSALIFDSEHVESKFVFQECKIGYEEFQTLRKSAYTINKLLETIQVDAILLYTLDLLLRNPDISKRFKANCKVMLVDEFQDMSLLQLKIVSLLADNVVAIGDIRQQIYAFNGACQEIVEQFKKYFPNYRERNLTQSFRCSKRIADFATKLILANGMGGSEFKGTDVEGFVNVTSHYSLSEICDNLEQSFIKNNNTFPKSIMFLFRNNFSSVPIAEELYKRKIPFRVNNYKPAHQIPVIADLCSIVDMVQDHNNPMKVEPLRMLIPELKKYGRVTDMPIYKIMQSTGLDLFSVSYNYQDGFLAEQVMAMLLHVQDLLRKNVKTSEIFNTIYPIYDENYLKYRAPFLDQDPSYYTMLVAPLVQKKTYRVFTTDELKKAEFIEQCNERRTGIRCYTFHAAKGTEADVVNILDADQAIIPNQKKLSRMIKRECNIDAAREVRNERSLVYVACTRAREVLNIYHNGQFSSLFTDMNEYRGLDVVYSTYKPLYNDVEIFQDFTSDLK